MKPELIVFTPLPPSRNGIADYAAELVTALYDHYNCLCVVSDDAPEAKTKSSKIEQISVSRYAAERRKHIGSRHLFQVGNNRGHAYILPWLERICGVTTIHDATLTNLITTLIPSGIESTAFRDCICANLDPIADELIDNIVDLGISGDLLSQEVNGLQIPARASRAVVVHSRVAASRILAVAPKTRVEIIPHLAACKPKPTPTPSAGRPFRILCLGFIARAKRIDLVIRAAKLLQHSGIDIEVIIAGDLNPMSYDLETDISALGVSNFVKYVGYLTDSDIDQNILSADIVVNLRDPTSGETSGVLTRAMSLGRAAIVTDIGWYSELPDNIVIKVPLSSMTPEGLAEQLMRPIKDDGFRNAVGLRAWETIARQAPNYVAKRYAAVIENAYQKYKVQSLIATQRLGLRFPRSSKTVASTPLWKLAGLMPLADPGWTLRILGGTKIDVAAAHDLGWKIVKDNEDCSTDACLTLEPAETDSTAELNAWIKRAVIGILPGGVLLVAGRWSEDRKIALRRKLAEHGLILARDIGIGDLPARIYSPIAPYGWRGMTFAPTNGGLGWTSNLNM